MRTVNGWTWSEEDKRWYVTRGSARITVRLPRSDPPEFHANLFGMRNEDISRGIRTGSTQNDVL